MPLRTTQYRFTAGELDPLLLGRSDIDKYYSAAETMKNVEILTQGGFKRADGLEFIQRLFRQVTREISPTISTPNGGTGANANDNSTSTSLVTTNNISTENPYVVVSYDLGQAKDIAFVDVVGISLTSSTNGTEFFIQVSNDNVNFTSLGTSLDLSSTAVTRRRAARGSYRYIRLARIGSTDLGTNKVSLQEFHVFTETANLSNSKLISFEFNKLESYILAITDKNIAVYRNGEHKADVRADRFTHDVIKEIDYTQSADTAIFVQEDLQPQKLIRQGADDKWLVSDIAFDHIPRFDFDPVISTPTGTLTPSGTSGVITLTDSVGTPFSTSSVNQYIQSSTAGGRARIIEYIDNKTVRAIVEFPFYSTDAIASGEWEYLTGFENVWSSSRGWPKTVTFHRARLYFGGSKSRPQTIWGSKINLFFNFDLGSLYDDDAIDATLNTDQINEIVNLKSTNGNLMIFTSGSEFSVASSVGSAITPLNFFPLPISQYGSESGLSVDAIDNNNIFVQRGGKSLIRYTYDTIQQITNTENISLLSSHLITSPQDIAIRKSTNTEESNVILLVNNENKLVKGTILLDQGVIGFAWRESENTTDGKFRNVAVDVETIYCVVERTVDGTTHKYLEKQDDDLLLDSCVNYTSGFPTDTFSGLDHLEGETVNIIADGSVLKDRTVSNGQVTIEKNATTSCHIGLDYVPIVKTLPAEIPQVGTKIGLKKRISEVTLRVNDTGDFTVNGYTVSFRAFNESTFDSAPPKFTGDKKIKGIFGWNERQQITISQSEPTELKVLSATIAINI